MLALLAGTALASPPTPQIWIEYPGPEEDRIERMIREGSYVPTVFPSDAPHLTQPQVVIVPAHESPATPDDPTQPEIASKPTIEIVFVLDTTGSMSGLLDGAKRTIWSIANRIATLEPSPRVRMGLVGYRDRGDDYVTKQTELTEDLDTVYADLMGYRASGGGDFPESVNQALHEAVTEFDWSTDSDVLRVIYLVGDAPPRMDFEDDVKYPDSCQQAASRGIIINAVRCGENSTTEQAWQQIASLAEGEMFSIPQDGGVIAIETPYDDRIAELGSRWSTTLIDYGDSAVLARQTAKRERADEIAATAATDGLADRMSYLASDSGRQTALGEQELVDDIASGRVELASVPEAQLPEALQAMSSPERIEFVEQQASIRRAIDAELAELTTQRNEYITAERARRAAEAGTQAEASFDASVVASLLRQAERIGVRFLTPTRHDGSPQANQSADDASDTDGTASDAEAAKADRPD